VIITFLGTGTSQGVPVIACSCPVCQSIDFKDKRLRSSVHILTKESSIIIDIGPDFRQQVLRAGIKHLDAILLTHEHKDHTAGLDDVRSYNFKQRMDMPVYGRKEVLDQIKTEFAYIFRESKYPGVPRVELHEITSEKFTVKDTIIEPIEVLHYKLPVHGFRVGKFAYITDAKTISKQEQEKIKGLDVLVLNALQKKPHISHLTLDEDLALIRELSPKKTYLTHISHNMGLARVVEPILPENVHLAFDGLKIEL